jgi:hypothetical protein
LRLTGQWHHRHQVSLAVMLWEHAGHCAETAAARRVVLAGRGEDEDEDEDREEPLRAAAFRTGGGTTRDGPGSRR